MQKRFLFVFFPFVACTKKAPNFACMYRTPRFIERGNGSALYNGRRSSATQANQQKE